MKKRVMAILLCFVMLSMTIGCSKNTGHAKEESIETSSEITEEGENDNIGGYIEEVIKVSDTLEYISDIAKLDNGDLILSGSDNAFNNIVFVSSDNGVSWSEKEIRHLTFEQEIRYTSLTLLNDRRILITYVFVDDANEDVKYAMADKDGTVNLVELGVKQERTEEGFNNAPTYFTALNNGDFIYRAMDSGEMVQIDGKSLKEKFRYDGGLMYSTAINIGNQLIIQSLDNDALYDMNTGELIKSLENELINNEQVGLFINRK